MSFFIWFLGLFGVIWGRRVSPAPIDPKTVIYVVRVGKFTLAYFGENLKSPRDFCRFREGMMVFTDDDNCAHFRTGTRSDLFELADKTNRWIDSRSALKRSWMLKIRLRWLGNLERRLEALQNQIPDIDQVRAEYAAPDQLTSEVESAQQ